MDIQDLGELSGDVLLFGGPYSNLQASEALIAQARDRCIPADRVICTGDVVAYGADPVSTLGAFRDFGAPVVAGNCEKQLASGADDCGCGFDENSTCDLLSRGWYPFAQARLGEAERAWMGNCPDLIRFTHGGRRYAVIHGGMTDIARFIWPVSPDQVFAEERAAIEAVAGPIDAVIAGHCGVAFHRRIGEFDWINAGAIGLPPHDGRPETRFAILSERGVIFEHLSYDHAAAADAMRAAGLTQGYDAALLSGVWPSEDVLPPEMRR
ncbi:MAG: metallophosphoesterase family protein [Rhodobacteraceae bacterium]|nr:metallophosphoesterase family protein [Paracoccaceae bacterium]